MRYGMAVVSGLSMMFDVKRILRIEADGIFAQGDNDLVSTDSRSYGLIPFDDVLGTVTYRLWPKPGRIKQG